MTDMSDLPQGSWLIITPRLFLATLEDAVRNGADEEAALFYMLQLVLGHLLMHQDGDDLMPQIAENLEQLERYKASGGREIAH